MNEQLTLAQYIADEFIEPGIVVQSVRETGTLEVEIIAADGRSWRVTGLFAQRLSALKTPPDA